MKQRFKKKLYKLQTSEDFENGYNDLRAISSNFNHYRKMLKKKMFFYYKNLKSALYYNQKY